MDSSVIITITILSLTLLLFLFAYINSKKIPLKRKEKIYSTLDELEIQINSSEVYARRDAYIKLDNLLNKALQLKYSNTLNCGENLKLAKKLFQKKSYQDIWDIHKIRNEIVHNDRNVSIEEGKSAYKVYKLSIKKILK